MNTSLNKISFIQTAFIQLDTTKCKACWKCIENCTNRVIDKINLPWHKHARFIQPDLCSGCYHCIDSCKHDALTKTPRHTATLQHRSAQKNIMLTVNVLLFLTGIFMAYSGMVLQIGFHMGGPHAELHSFSEGQYPMQYEQLRQIDTDKIVSGLNYFSWSATHKVVIIAFSLLMLYHTYIHWKWYKTVFRKRLISKNFQVLILSALFILVALTGLIPWFVDITGGTTILRTLLIEIHDKLTLLLIIFLILHFLKRARWYTTSFSAKHR